tara:strand:+ start:15818 stop:16006 length:189 start_codon:yes stop_codon:yes gene_type:complete
MKAQKTKTYRVIMTERKDGTVEIMGAEKLALDLGRYRTKWEPISKRRFARRFLNTIDKFTTT